MTTKCEQRVHDIENISWTRMSAGGQTVGCQQGYGEGGRVSCQHMGAENSAPGSQQKICSPISAGLTTPCGEIYVGEGEHEI